MDLIEATVALARRPGQLGRARTGSRRGSSSTCDLRGISLADRHRHRPADRDLDRPYAAAARRRRSTSRTSGGRCRPSPSIGHRPADHGGDRPAARVQGLPDAHRHGRARDPADPRQRLRRHRRASTATSSRRRAGWACASARSSARSSCRSPCPSIIAGVRSAAVQVVATATLGAIFGGGGPRPLPRRGHRPARRPDDCSAGVVLVAVLCARRRGRSFASSSACSTLDRGSNAARMLAERDGRAIERRRRRGCGIPSTTRCCHAVGATGRRDRSATAHARDWTGGEDPCGCSARSPSGRRCWCCSAPARRVGAAAASRTIKIGSDGFDEARVVARSTPRSLEANGLHGRPRRHRPRRPRRHGGGARERPDRPQARVHRQRPRLLRAATPTSDPDTNKQRAPGGASTSKGGGITVLGYTPGQDTNAFVVRKETADEHEPHEDERPDGGRRTSSSGASRPTARPTRSAAAPSRTQYGIDVADADVTLLDACSTPDGRRPARRARSTSPSCARPSRRSSVNGWVRLEDDKKTQPADNIAPIVRNDLLAKVDDKAAFEKLLNDVSAKIDTATLADLYNEVAVDKKDLKDVAADLAQGPGHHPVAPRPTPRATEPRPSAGGSSMSARRRGAATVSGVGLSCRGQPEPGERDRRRRPRSRTGSRRARSGPARTRRTTRRRRPCRSRPPPARTCRSWPARPGSPTPSATPDAISAAWPIVSSTPIAWPAAANARIAALQATALRSSASTSVRGRPTTRSPSRSRMTTSRTRG